MVRFLGPVLGLGGLLLLEIVKRRGPNAPFTREKGSDIQAILKRDLKQNPRVLNITSVGDADLRIAMKNGQQIWMDVRSIEFFQRKTNKEPLSVRNWASGKVKFGKTQHQAWLTRVRKAAMAPMVVIAVVVRPEHFKLARDILKTQRTEQLKKDELNFLLEQEGSLSVNSSISDPLHITGAKRKAGVLWYSVPASRVSGVLSSKPNVKSWDMRFTSGLRKDQSGFGWGDLPVFRAKDFSVSRTRGGVGFDPSVLSR